MYACTQGVRGVVLSCMSHDMTAMGNMSAAVAYASP